MDMHADIPIEFAPQSHRALNLSGIEYLVHYGKNPFGSVPRDYPIGKTVLVNGEPRKIKMCESFALAMIRAHDDIGLIFEEEGKS
jgi:hypothetical protein